MWCYLLSYSVILPQYDFISPPSILDFAQLQRQYGLDLHDALYIERDLQYISDGSIGVPGLILLNPFFKVIYVKVYSSAHSYDRQTPGPYEPAHRGNRTAKVNTGLLDRQEPLLYKGFLTRPGAISPAWRYVFLFFQSN